MTQILDIQQRNEKLVIGVPNLIKVNSRVISNQELMPHELWHKVISYLPLSQICRLGKVSRKFRGLVTQHSVWRDICQRAGLLSRIPHNNTIYETILSRYSKYICELCGMYCARKVGSMVSLPVIIESFDMIISLCRDCRVQFYQSYPEPERDLPKRKMIYPISCEWMKCHTLPLYSAMVEYALAEYELKQLSCAYHGSSINVAPLVKHYDERDVIVLARKIHGGEIGITRALMCSLNMFRPLSLQHTKVDSGGSCSREYARKMLISKRCQSTGQSINYSCITYQEYILSGVGSVATTLHDMQEN
ncbi:uncharacterized protein EV154DRAFT_522362 [Mucor mucedo]|nr:uncharacterized protein EV154DRAFT_522362 [Mucor mucedo]KAI7884121.1 hypothetical protein EV154DRAFT_522362 [Mucor mucedo]